MSKAVEYQVFVNKLRKLSDRPVWLRTMFDQGMTAEQAAVELRALADKGCVMFKRGRSGPDLPALRVERITTLEGARRHAARGALKALLTLGGRRMTGAARIWVDGMIAELRRQLRKGSGPAVP